ncbi:hypothetical protein SAMN05443574_103301 [Haloarcula vallismortis]|uniref:Uncharacterized protein n=1 Tax=Haloarcula vallismortis TaxID=28442 RepID=A0A1H2TP38_HALVA|nr:hypothetical protein SAMN05443574_103301 [Haloarcula vallismortis]
MYALNTVEHCFHEKFEEYKGSPLTFIAFENYDS